MFGCATGVSINWVGVTCINQSATNKKSSGGAEVTLAASGRKAGTIKSVSHVHLCMLFSITRVEFNVPASYMLLKLWMCFILSSGLWLLLCCMPGWMLHHHVAHAVACWFVLYHTI